MSFRIDSMSSRASAVWHALIHDPPTGSDRLVDESPPLAVAKSQIDVQRLMLREKDSRRFLEQIARHEPLPNILKNLVDVVERHNPALRACVTVIREGRVCYVVVPTLGGRFASVVEDVATCEENRLDSAPVIANISPPTGPAITLLENDPAWSLHREVLVKHGLRACWSVPIISENEPMGTLSVFTGYTGSPTQADLELMATVADQAAIAIEHQDLIERQAHQSLHDPLTSLPNWALLEDRLQNAIGRAQRGNSRVGFFLLNIDRFKVINDTLGHGCGDELLRQIAGQLRRSVRASDTVARIGADEFAIVAPELRDRNAATAVADKLLALLAETFVVAGREVVTTSSVGASVYPEDGTDTGMLRRAADRALSRAKTLGRNRYAFFDPGMGQAPVERMELDMQAQLGRAIENRELSLNYQPQVNARGQIVGVEALLRWENAKLGKVSPAQFISIAEQTGLIVPIGEWVLREACRQAQEWNQRPDRSTLRMAVNVSALQFAQPQFLQIVQDTLKESGLPPSALELELTESLLMQNTQDAAAKLTALRSMGVAAAIDDFGTGYSSLAYLRRLPIDTLKIDRSFVADVTPENADDSATAVIRAILSMARSLGLQVVAEGVETEAQSKFLIHNGCQLMQGYLFGRPQTAGQIDKVLDALALPADSLPLARTA